MFSKTRKETQSQAMMGPRAHIKQTERAMACIIEDEDDSEGSGDEGDLDEIEESMRQLFPEQIEGCTEVK
jgi:hypothetical protein